MSQQGHKNLQHKNLQHKNLQHKNLQHIFSASLLLSAICCQPVHSMRCFYALLSKHFHMRGICEVQGLFQSFVSRVVTARGIAVLITMLLW